MRLRPQKFLERQFGRASECMVPNQSIPRVPTLADQSDRGTDFYI